jgi:predicted kinase
VSNTGTLHFLCGKMASGKSTLATRLAAEHGAVLISEDVWLQRLYPVEISGFDDYLKYSARLKTVVAPHVSDLLQRGLNVVLDFPANVPKTRLWIRGLFEAARVPHILHFVDTPDERCLEQLQQRNRDRPEGSMEMTVEQFHAITALFRPPEPSENFEVRRYASP